MSFRRQTVALVLEKNVEKLRIANKSLAEENSRCKMALTEEKNKNFLLTQELFNMKIEKRQIMQNLPQMWLNAINKFAQESITDMTNALNDVYGLGKQLKDVTKTPDDYTPKSKSIVETPKSTQTPEIVKRNGNPVNKHLRVNLERLPVTRLSEKEEDFENSNNYETESELEKDTSMKNDKSVSDEESNEDNTLKENEDESDEEQLKENGDESVEDNKLKENEDVFELHTLVEQENEDGSAVDYLQESSSHLSYKEKSENSTSMTACKVYISPLPSTFALVTKRKKNQPLRDIINNSKDNIERNSDSYSKQLNDNFDGLTPPQITSTPFNVNEHSKSANMLNITNEETLTEKYSKVSKRMPRNGKRKCLNENSPDSGRYSFKRRSTEFNSSVSTSVTPTKREDRNSFRHSLKRQSSASTSVTPTKRENRNSIRNSAQFESTMPANKSAYSPRPTRSKRNKPRISYTEKPVNRKMRRE